MADVNNINKEADDISVIDDGSFIDMFKAIEEQAIADLRAQGYDIPEDNEEE